MLDARLARSSGIGVYIRELFPRVIRLLQDVSFRVLVRPGEMQELPDCGPERVQLRIATSKLYSIREQLELRALIPRDARLYWSPHYVVPVAYGGRLVATVHDLAHLALPQFFGQPHRRIYAKAMFAHLRRRAAHVFCDSEFTAQQLHDLTGFPRSRSSVVHLGISQSWQALPSTAPDPPRSKPYLLYVGNVKPHKNLVLLLQAFQRLLPHIPHDLIIVGRREGFLTRDEQIDHAAAALGDRVRFTGEVSDDSLREFYSGAEILVFPSLYEGFGLPPLEAMACGTPALVSARASLPEICGDAAEYCDPGSAESIAAGIQRLIHSPERRAELRRRGLARSALFRWEDTANRVARTLCTLLAPEGDAATQMSSPITTPTAQVRREQLTRGHDESARD